MKQPCPLACQVLGRNGASPRARRAFVGRHVRQAPETLDGQVAYGADKGTRAPEMRAGLTQMHDPGKIIGITLQGAIARHPHGLWKPMEEPGPAVGVVRPPAMRKLVIGEPAASHRRCAQNPPKRAPALRLPARASRARGTPSRWCANRSRSFAPAVRLDHRPRRQARARAQPTLERRHFICHKAPCSNAPNPSA